MILNSYIKSRYKRRHNDVVIRHVDLRCINSLANVRLDVPRFARVQFALMMREMATSYGRSYFGYLWAIFDPVGAIVVLSVAFSLAFGSPPLGDSFPLFYATGYLPFVTYNIMQQKVNGAVRENRQLLFYPRVTYMDAIISRFVLTLVTQTLVAAIVFFAIMMLYQVPLRIDVVPVLIGLFGACVLGLGIGSLNSVLVFLFPSWRNMWGIITRPLFLMSCVFYLFDSLPVWARSVLWFNPLVHLIGMTRDGFYPVYDADYVSIAYPFVVAGLCLLSGLLMLRRNALAMING